MGDAFPLKKPGPSFRDWCLWKAKYWQDFHDDPDRQDKEKSKEFCSSMRNRYLAALERARKGFQWRPA